MTTKRSEQYAHHKGWGCILVVLSTLLLNACSHAPASDRQAYRSASLEEFYSRLQGTRYQYGGSDTAGMDCSALVVTAYDDLFDLKLPRTTNDQSRLGNRVRYSALQTGDLVFFKTGFKKRHVGIYLDDGVFIHASDSNGVIKSSLENSYWNKRYWKSRRLLD